jgi:hypothetical protein
MFRWPLLLMRPSRPREIPHSMFVRIPYFLEAV